MLHISGLDTGQAWGMNRTKVAVALRTGDLPAWRTNYTAYYLSLWDYFLSGFTDSDAARSAIENAARLLTESAELGRQWLAANPRPETAQ